MVRLFWSECDYVTCICDLFVGWYLALVDDLKDIHAFDVAMALEESNKFIHTRIVPTVAYFFVRMAGEVSVRGHLVQFLVLYRPCCTCEVANRLCWWALNL